MQMLLSYFARRRQPLIGRATEYDRVILDPLR
jgi:hypothetical protein